MPVEVVDHSVKNSVVDDDGKRSWTVDSETAQNEAQEK